MVGYFFLYPLLDVWASGQSHLGGSLKQAAQAQLPALLSWERAVAPHTAVQLCSAPSSAASRGVAPGSPGPRPPGREGGGRLGRTRPVRSSCYSCNSEVLFSAASPRIQASHPLPSTSLALASPLTGPSSPVPSLLSLPPGFLHLTLGIKETASGDRVNTRRPACSTSSWLHNSGFLRDRKKIRMLNGLLREGRGKTC